ncbi:MAG: PhpK family radical SAM P-methyltransferase [Candidatus Aminicenantes bacterium]|nr:PhpK family radical SAM P-methyltransferase [Candidatus Aminicenantes bacterium]NIM81783.1 PhpK family radical SAM P-methyltransferase [Candidatus Aminicenantes bacterium]NIN21155.1 PhpK family radical SAM P-methyltransferase [Candidatus Aminicenantes bacterium]NIN44979.1 PhpK family radical SAM P-methyltransferase [Candidatus Aminicenantes bacterium]NIN87793.1 PhpK family radical SAM P-methyltransferase [Candidatus Aminicenantes bacterium]
MEKVIDCLFIGHNEMDFVEYEKNVRKMGTASGAYRDLGKNFILYNNRPYPVSETYNLFYCSGPGDSTQMKPLGMGETFSNAIAYLGTYLNRRGMTFDYVNSFTDEKDRLAEKLKQENILTIAIITTLYVAAFPILEVMDFIKTYNRTAKIVIGGPYVTTQVRTLEPEELTFLFKSIGADVYVNSSQGEAALVEIIHALKTGHPLHRVKNIYHQSGDGYAVTPFLQEDNKLSENMVNWDLFAPNAGEYVNVRTAISCPFACAFCGFPEHAGKYQPAEVAALEQELTQLDRIGTVKSVYFIDDTFNVPIKRFKDILRMIIKNRYRYRWHCNFRCQFSDREMVELMKESGCIGVFLGIESGNNQILKNMNKKASREKYLEGAALLKEYGIVTHGSFIVGFPGETEETVNDTISFIQESQLDFYRAQLWYCETITPIWREREKYKIKGSQYEWSHATMDSKTACDLVDKIFFTIRDSVWVPQYNFEFDHMVHLIHRGMSIRQVKDFLKAFYTGIRERMENPSRKEVSFEVIRQLKSALGDERPPDEGIEDAVNIVTKYQAGFTF